MRDSLITRLVVGEPQTLAIGRPVGQTLGNHSGGALRWQAGRWVGIGASSLQWLKHVFAKREPTAIVVRPERARVEPRWTQRELLACAVAAATLAAVIPLALVALRPGTAMPNGLPIAPAAVIGTVRVVDAAYVPPQPAPAAAEISPLPIAGTQAGSTAPMPFAPPTEGPQVEQRAREVPQAAREKPPAVAAKPGTAGQKDSTTSGTAPNQREQQRVSAVVLDEASPRAARAQAPSTAPAAPSVQQGKVLPPAAMAPTPHVQAKATLERGTGLVAITPDAKVAVFTNPKTRLPQQFKIGDQLPGGDTIRAIDAKDGKVVSSTKEYTLD